MPQPTRLTGPSLLAVVGLLASLLLVLVPVDHASAATTGRVVGEITGADGVGHVRMTWFSSDWRFIGRRNVDRGAYSLSLAPGTYWIQFTDRRPAYDVDKYAPTDLKVTIRANRTTIKRARMHRGAAITGTVRAGGTKAGGARIVAANAAEQSFEVKANKQGQFALGGLPTGSYSVFTYDRTRQWVGKSTYLPGLQAGRATDVAIALRKHAGKLLVLLGAGGREIHQRVFVTAVSRRTGQFWTQRATPDGSVTFDGLFPGRYRLVMPGVGDYLARTGAVTKGLVRPGHLAIGKFNLTQRGASVSGIVVDHEDPGYPLEGASVRLFDRYGHQLGSTTSDADGLFHFGGQLTSQPGLTVVAQPGPYSPYLGQGTHYCKYASATSASFAVVTGEDSDIGPVELPHLPAAEQDGVQCYPSDGS